MAEKNEYFTQKLENGTLQISEDVVASVAAAAVLEVEGVCGLSSSISTDSRNARYEDDGAWRPSDANERRRGQD